MRHVLSMQRPDGATYDLVYDTVLNNLFFDEQPLGNPNNSNGCNCAGRQPIVLRLSLGKRCNFSCAYCSQCDKDKPQKTADGPMRRRLVEAVARWLDGRQLDMVHFWGGEPLTYFEEMKDFLRLFTEICLPKHGFFYATNGSLLYGERLEWTLKHNVNVSISWDGEGQVLRGRDIMHNPAVVEAIRRIHRRNPGELAFNPVVTSALVDIQEYARALEELLQSPDFRIAEARPATVTDEASWACRLPEDRFLEFSRGIFLGLVSGKLNQWQKPFEMAGKFRRELGRPIKYGSRCFVMSGDTPVMDMAGNIITCQNFEADETHNLGSMFDLAPGGPIPIPDAQALRKLWDERCRDCVVLPMCRGHCPFAPEEYKDYNCAAMYHYTLPILGLALHQMTGDLLCAVRPQEDGEPIGVTGPGVEMARTA